MRYWTVAALLLLAACTAGDPEPVAEEALGGDPTDFTQAPVTPATTPTSTMFEDLGLTVRVLETRSFGNHLDDPQGLGVGLDATGEFAGVRYELVHDGTEPVQLLSLLLSNHVTDGTRQWQISAGPSAYVVTSTDDVTIYETVGPGFTVTSWAVADVPPGTQLTGLVVDEVTYTVS